MTNYNAVHAPNHMVEENDFTHWCVDAKPTDALCYYRGELSRNCERDRVLRAKADFVYKKYMKGTVCLVQKRLAKNDFLYFAVRTKEAYS